MTDAEIKAKYQLLTNQRNQQKERFVENVIRQEDVGLYSGFLIIIKVIKNGIKAFRGRVKKQKKVVRVVDGMM